MALIELNYNGKKILVDDELPEEIKEELSKEKEELEKTKELGFLKEELDKIYPSKKGEEND